MKSFRHDWNFVFDWVDGAETRRQRIYRVCRACEMQERASLTRGPRGAYKCEYTRGILTYDRMGSCCGRQLEAK